MVAFLLSTSVCNSILWSEVHTQISIGSALVIDGMVPQSSPSSSAVPPPSVPGQSVRGHADRLALVHALGRIGLLQTGGHLQARIPSHVCAIPPCPIQTTLPHPCHPPHPPHPTAPRRTQPVHTMLPTTSKQRIPRARRWEVQPAQASQPQQRTRGTPPQSSRHTSKQLWGEDLQSDLQSDLPVPLPAVNIVALPAVNSLSSRSSCTTLLE